MKKKEQTNKILSVQEILHLQSDTHEKTKIMPDVDTSKYILKQNPKSKAARNFAPVVNLTEEQRRQFSQGGSAPSREAVLAEKARQAIEVAELHAKEEADKKTKAAAKKTAKSVKPTNKLPNEIRSGNFDFSALIEGTENLKDTI